MTPAPRPPRRGSSPTPPGYLRLENVRDRTLLLDLEQALPECYLKQEERPALPTVACLSTDGACDNGAVCMPALARRAQILFHTFKTVDLLVLPFRQRGRGNQYAVAVTRAFDVSVIHVNKSGLALVREQADVVLGRMPVGF